MKIGQKYAVIGRLRITMKSTSNTHLATNTSITRSPDTPKELAARMAHITHNIRDMTLATFQQNEISDTLRDLYNTFKQALIPDLAVAAFADIFAQMLACRLFAARYNHTHAEPFRRQNAARAIPNTNPLPTELFEMMSREMDDGPFVNCIDDLVHLLAQTDMKAISADFGRRHED